MEVVSLHPAELASLVAGIGAIRFGCRATKFAPTWTSQGGKPKQRGCFSGIFWFPNLLPPGRARVESLSSNAYAYPRGFQISRRLTPLPGILDFTPDIENAQVQNARARDRHYVKDKIPRLRVGLAFHGVFCERVLTYFTVEILNLDPFAP